MRSTNKYNRFPDLFLVHNFVLVSEIQQIAFYKKVHLFIEQNGPLVMRMREFAQYVLSFNFKGLFVNPTSNFVLQAFRAFVVGGIAFVADAGVLWVLTVAGIYYLVSAVFGFFVGVGFNFVLSVKFVFKEKASVSKVGEVAMYVFVGAIGLALTIGLMWFFTEVVGLFFMFSRGIAAIIVFSWNFLSRKFTIYKGDALK